MNQKESLNLNTNNMLFVSDLPNETCDEDLIDFFKNYHCTSVKLQR
jgi:hypothetical protein